MRLAVPFALLLTLCCAVPVAAPAASHAQVDNFDIAQPEEVPEVEIVPLEEELPVVEDEPVMIDGSDFLMPDSFNADEDRMERLEREVFGDGGATGDGATDQAADTPYFPDLPAGFEPDEETLASVQAAVQSYYNYRVTQFDHRARVFEWQHRSTQLIFVVVVVIVAAGLYFSWMQFHASKSGTETGTSTFEASGTGFKVSSPVVGVIVLALSLAFFYLYLIHVYPITDLF